MIERPLYETQRDRDNEYFYKKVLEELWSIILFKTKHLAPADFLGVRMIDLKTLCYIEFKMRNCRSTTYAEYYVFQHKIDRAVEIAELSGVRFILVVKFLDKLLAVELTKEKLKDYRLEFNGRFYSTRDRFDIQKAYHIPLSEFVLARDIKF
jgi:hypothetical protein